MADRKCKNSAALRTIKRKKLDTANSIVRFEINEDLETCVTQNAKRYSSITGDTVSYNPYIRPDDKFNCGGSCVNTGTLFVDATTGPFGQTVRFDANAVEFAGGVITYYVYVPQAGTYTITSTIADVSEPALANADVYTVTKVATGPGFIPISVLLTDVPTSIAGTGWDPGRIGALLNVTVTAPAGVTQIGFSSYSIFDSIEEFELNDVVEMACLSSVAPTLSLTAVTSACGPDGYNLDDISISYTIEGRRVTPNFEKLNPLYGRGEKTVGHDYVTKTFEVEAVTIDGKDYGYVQLTNLEAESCDGIAVQTDDDCDVTSATLTRVNIPMPITLSEVQFNVLPDGRLLVHSYLVGRTIFVAFPELHAAQHYVFKKENAEGRRVRLIVPFETEDGKRTIKGYYVYNNVLVTTPPFPTQNGEEMSLSVTIEIRAQEDGQLGEQFILTDE